MQRDWYIYLFAKKTDLAGLKADENQLDLVKLKNVPTNLSNLTGKLDKLDADKLLHVLVDLSKLSDVVKNDVVKKDVYNAKVKNIGNKIPVTNLVTNASLNAKIKAINAEILSIANSVITSALTANENKITNVSNLVKKADYNTKISETKKKITDHDHDKYISVPEFNELTAEKFTPTLKQVNLTSN